ncbi:MAG: hypothetical protein J2P41_24155 [Blastocatellia bacterium]|nr:hypothetical protein [Blastocatellia bacterium]
MLCDYCNRQFRAFSPASPPSRAQREIGRRRLDPANIEPKKAPVISEKPKNPAPQKKRDFIPPSGGMIIPLQNDLRTEIARVQEARMEREAQEPHIAKDYQKTVAACPECGSHWVRRRQRSGLERAIFVFTNHRAFICRSCDASFYARVGADERATTSIIRSSRSANSF